MARIVIFTLTFVCILVSGVVGFSDASAVKSSEKSYSLVVSDFDNDTVLIIVSDPLSDAIQHSFTKTCTYSFSRMYEPVPDIFISPGVEQGPECRKDIIVTLKKRYGPIISNKNTIDNYISCTDKKYLYKRHSSKSYLKDCLRRERIV